MLLGVAAGTAFADMFGEADIWLAARYKTVLVYKSPGRNA